MKAEGQGERTICDVKNGSSLACGQHVDNKDGGEGRHGDEGGEDVGMRVGEGMNLRMPRNLKEQEI